MQSSTVRLSIIAFECLLPVNFYASVSAYKWVWDLLAALGSYQQRTRNPPWTQSSHLIHIWGSSNKNTWMDKASGTKKTKIESKTNYVRNKITKQMRTTSAPRPFLKHTDFYLFAPWPLSWNFPHSHGVLEAEVSFLQDSVSMETEKVLWHMNI